MQQTILNAGKETNLTESGFSRLVGKETSLQRFEEKRGTKAEKTGLDYFDKLELFISSSLDYLKNKGHTRGCM